MADAFGFPYGPASITPPPLPKPVAAYRRIADPLYADVVGRMRRAGFNDTQIEKSLEKLPQRPEPSAPRTAPRGMETPSPAQESPAATTPVQPAPLPGSNEAFDAMRQRVAPAADAARAAAAAAPPDYLQPDAPPGPTPIPGTVAYYDAIAQAHQGPQRPIAVPPVHDPQSDAFAGPGTPPPALPGPPPPKPPITPEMLAAFGGGAPVTTGAGRPPMPTPPVPGANPFQGQPPMPMGPPTRPVVGPRPAAGAPVPPSAGQGGGPNYGDIGRSLLEFGLATMAAGGRPGATIGSAVGEGGLAALRSRTERQRYDEAKSRADRAEKRADRSLSLQEKGQKATSDYRKAALDLQAARLQGDQEYKKAYLELQARAASLPKPTNAADAVDAARKLATLKQSDGFGGETTIFDAEVYNATIKALGYAKFTLPDGGDTDAQAAQIRQDLKDGKITRDQAKQKLQALGIQ